MKSVQEFVNSAAKMGVHIKSDPESAAKRDPDADGSEGKPMAISGDSSTSGSGSGSDSGSDRGSGAVTSDRPRAKSCVKLNFHGPEADPPPRGSDYSTKMTWLQMVMGGMEAAGDSASDELAAKVRDSKEKEAELDERKKKAGQNDKKKITRGKATIAKLAMIEAAKYKGRTFTDSEDDNDGKYEITDIKKKTPNGRKMYVYCKRKGHSGSEDDSFELPYVYKKPKVDLPNKGF